MVVFPAVVVEDGEPPESGLRSAMPLVVLPLITPIEQQGFVKGRSPQNCIITFCLVHEALKRQDKSALFFSLDQEKAYDKLCPDYLWSVMSHLGFPPIFILVVRALQHQAESRILLNGNLLPPFIVGRGVRQGCPLSPLLYVIASIPIINRLREENGRGRIQPVVLNGDCQVSSICLADDLAIFTTIQEDSVANVLLLLRLVELASGGKVNILKSKVLMLGKCQRFPAWLSGIGLMLVDKRDVTVYLGAPLTTVWHGSDNGDNLLGRLKGKAEFYAATSLSFESRIVALKHGIFPTLIYQMLVTRFKKRTLKRFDQMLREYVWSTDVDGRKKQSLSAWESLIMPVSGGGLGSFSAEDFQTALISRSILKALRDPDASLWASIFASIFLGTSPGSMLTALSLSPGPKIPAVCPVASLFLESWSKLIALFRWRPKDGLNFHLAAFKELLFLQARTTLIPAVALTVVGDTLRWCLSVGIHSLSTLRARSSSLGAHGISPRIGCWPLLVDLLASQTPLLGSTISISGWTAENGNSLDSSWSASKIYTQLRSDKRQEQGLWLNSKWGLQWSLPQWEVCWKYMALKGLTQRNKTFLWRIFVAAFYVGKNAQRLGFSEFSCTFCDGGVEDISHAIWLCPRWRRFWLEVARKVPGWDQILQLRENLLTLPHLLSWAFNAPVNLALFRAWFLAVSLRCIWAERCTFKFQGKLNFVSLTKVIICLMEEINARRTQLDPIWIRDFVPPLLSLLAVIPNRFQKLLIDS
ncbi:hypothetical protein R1sor_022042 [Riccia sorocarpa]|uniref:Reverse transcriptase domain-containing protein n=1 Tax=Riccia sorocarpa TaxID=122646 RepID=A0ABD3GK90_9MARC